MQIEIYASQSLKHLSRSELLAFGEYVFDDMYDRYYFDPEVEGMPDQWTEACWYYFGRYDDQGFWLD